MAAPLAAAGPASWLFDAWSLVYDLPLIQRFTYRPVHAAVLRVLGRHEPLRRVLDVGCGTGLLSDQIAREHPATRVVGCDFSLGMLRRAAAARDGGAVWVRGDALRLPFRDTTFDALVCTEALHWFP
ncbi:MAG TPA: methyltransferase domain-containing protein, partial [Candidatus Binatia bacterium]|nr:methyltransferase domain-containing protein [Candidatus Binatia bacterium]